MSVMGLCAEAHYLGHLDISSSGSSPSSPPVPKPHLSPGKAEAGGLTCSICLAYSWGLGGAPGGLLCPDPRGHSIENTPFMPQYMLVRRVLPTHFTEEKTKAEGNLKYSRTQQLGSGSRHTRAQGCPLQGCDTIQSRSHVHTVLGNTPIPPHPCCRDNTSGRQLPETAGNFGEVA